MSYMSIDVQIILGSPCWFSFIQVILLSTPIKPVRTEQGQMFAVAVNSSIDSLRELYGLLADVRHTLDLCRDSFLLHWHTLIWLLVESRRLQPIPHFGVLCFNTLLPLLMSPPAGQI